MSDSAAGWRGAALLEMVAADCPHPVGCGEDWHESVVLFAYDTSQNLSFYCRIGSWPHRNSAQEWLYVETAAGTRFRSLGADLPIESSSRRADGFAAGGLTWTVEQRSVHIRADLPDLVADLRYHDYYPGVSFKVIGRHRVVPPEKMGHLESSGWLEGSITIDGKNFVLEGARAHRDHSWGPRDDRFRVARWLVGTTGPELSHAFISTIDSRGVLAEAGWVMRGGVLEHAAAVDFVVLLNSDGVTARGARGRFVLESGEVIVIDAVIRSSFITGNHTSHGGPGSYVCSEGVSTTLVNGVEGIGCMTIANSSAGVGEAIKVVDPLFSTIESGITYRPLAEPLIGVAELLSPDAGRP